MFKNVIVGVDDNEASRDAIALAQTLVNRGVRQLGARLYGQPVLRNALETADDTARGRRPQPPGQVFFFPLKVIVTVVPGLVVPIGQAGSPIFRVPVTLIPVVLILTGTCAVWSGSDSTPPAPIVT